MKRRPTWKATEIENKISPVSRENRFGRFRKKNLPSYTLKTIHLSITLSKGQPEELSHPEAFPLLSILLVCPTRSPWLVHFLWVSDSRPPSLLWVRLLPRLLLTLRDWTALSQDQGHPLLKLRLPVSNWSCWLSVLRLPKIADVLPFREPGRRILLCIWRRGDRNWNWWNHRLETQK